MFENSYWIAEKDNTYNENSIFFRKSFEIEKPFKSVTAYVCGLGYEETTLNGRKVTDSVLTTPVTSYDKRVLYSEYDLTASAVLGENVIGVEIGNGWYNAMAFSHCYANAIWRDIPKMIAQIDILYCDGDIKTVVSDTTWRSSDGGCVFNCSRQGEIYDARLEKPGWNTPGYNADSWQRVIITRAAGKPYPKTNPPIRVIRQIKPVSVNNNIYDFGENITGWAKIRAKGERGREIVLKYDEMLTESGELRGKVIPTIHTDKMKLRHEDKYIMKGEGTEEFAPKFNYHGFRYVRVENAPEEFDISAEVVHTDLKRRSSFECSNEMLNRIHEATVSSTLGNFVDIPTDCPHREQNGWTGDAQLSAEQALINFDMVEAYRKWLLDFKDAQRPSGQLPGMIPTDTEEWFNGWNGPAWDSAIILIPWYIYKYTGDRSVIFQMLDNMELYMQYMKSMADNDLVDYGLGDWHTLPQMRKCPSVVTDSAYYYYDSVIMAKCMKLAGRDGTHYKKQSLRIKQAWREAFLNDEALSDCQTFYAAAIYFGLLSEDEVPRYAEMLAELVIKNDYHIDCGIIGTKCIFNALCDNGYSEVVYKMVTNPTMPSYAYWINNGMTTLCESWDMHDSCNHHMFSEVDNWLYRYVAGICTEEDGVIIRPIRLAEVKNVKANIGDLRIERNGNVYKIFAPHRVILELNGSKKELTAGVYEFVL